MFVPKVARSGFIKKPWGWEYILIESKSVLVSYLSIDPMKSTSLHCHPTKITGYIVLDGSVEVEFLSGFKDFIAGDSVNFRPGLFHRTTAGLNGAIVLEIESPADKMDLVRLEDFSGRSDSQYETELCALNDEVYNIYIMYKEVLESAVSEPQDLLLGTCMVSCFHMEANDFIESMPNETIFSVIDKAIPMKNSLGSKSQVNLIDLGNVATVSVLKRLLPVLDFSGKYRFLTVNKIKPS